MPNFSNYLKFKTKYRLMKVMKSWSKVLNTLKCWPDDADYKSSRVNVSIKCQGNPSKRQLLFKGIKVSLIVALEKESRGLQCQFQLVLVGALTKKSRVQVVQTHNFQVYYKIHFLTASSLQETRKISTESSTVTNLLLMLLCTEPKAAGFI